MDYKDLSAEHLDSHIDKIIDICRNIPMHQITILTGGNALGKSLIRKQMPYAVHENLASENIKVNPEHCVSSVSMQLRTDNNSSFGVFSSMMCDMPHSSTSDSTLSLLKNLLNDVKNRFIVIDELEIGMGKEVQMGTCNYLNNILPDIMKNNYGVLVITHSENVVQWLNHDNFINIEGLTEDEWVNREIVPVDPEDIMKWADALFVAVRNRENKK